MNCFAMIALLLAAPLVQAETPERSCKAALAELAVSAQAAEIAVEAADRTFAEVDALGAKLENCRKERSGKGGCTKIAESLEEAEQALDLAEEALTLSLEEVDAAYDDFDVACSWEEGEANVLVRSSKARARASQSTPRHAARADARSPASSAR